MPLISRIRQERKQDFHCGSRPVRIVPDEAILEWQEESLSKADFLKKENDPALKETVWEKEV